MIILKNATRNILRSRGRTLLIGIIILVISASSAVSLAISNAAGKAREEGLAQLEVTGSVVLSREEAMAAATEAGQDPRGALAAIEEIPLETLAALAEDPNVKDFFYSMSSSIDGTDAFLAVSQDTETEEAATTDAAKLPTGTGGGSSRLGTQGDFTLEGASSEAAISILRNGTATVTEGVLPDFTSAEARALISSELALLNGLEVGGRFTLANPNQEEELYTFTVAGIYELSGTEEDGTIAFSSSQDPANKIYISYPALSGIIGNSEAVSVVETDEDGITTTTALRQTTSGIFAFGDVSSYEAFKSAADPQLPEYHSVTSTDISAYEESLKPLEDLSRFSQLFLMVVLLIGSIILVVLNIFNIRERKYEVGVLTAIGMKKGKVAMQFIAEIFMVTFLFILLGTGIGAAISVPASNELLGTQVTQTEEAVPLPGSGGGGGAGRLISGEPVSAAKDYVDQVNAAVDGIVLAELMGIGFLLGLVSSAAGIVFILRYEPLQILAERS